MKRRGGHYYGLVNEGATCYLNSVLQVLFMTPDFRHTVQSYYLNNVGLKHIDSELSDIFNNLETNHTHTQGILNKLGINNVSVQRDAAEHYEKILRLTSRNASQIFHGELVNMNECKDCGTQTESAAGFWLLPLPLVDNNNGYSVEKGIDDFFHESVITGDEQMYCEACDKKCDAVLRCDVKQYPEVLVLLLKRFEMIYEGDSARQLKINCRVKMSDTLHMKKNHTYKLYAFVEHFGDLQSGHYKAKIKSLDKEAWYIFDDLNVEKSAYQHFQLDSTETSENVYLLFYQLQKGESSHTNKARHDTWTHEILPATVSSFTNETYKSMKEEKKVMKPSAEQSFFEYSNKPAATESSKDRKNKKHDPIGSEHKRFKENVPLYDNGTNSGFQSYPDAVHLKKPADTREEASSRNKRLKHDSDRSVKANLRKQNLEMEESQPSSDFKNASSCRLPLPNTGYDSGEWRDKAPMRQQPKHVGYGIVPEPSVKSRGEQQHLSQPWLQESRKKEFQFDATANRHKPVERSRSFASTHYSREDRNSSGERLRNEESYGKFDRGRSGSERLSRVNPYGSTSFNVSSQQKHWSQDDQLENFSREVKRTDNQRGGSQSSNSKRQKERETSFRQSAEAQPLRHMTPQLCLERVEQKNTSSQRSYRENVQLSKSRLNASDDESKTNKSTLYSPENVQRNSRKYTHVIKIPEAEISSDEEGNNPTISKTLKTTEGQSLNKHGGNIVLETNGRKTKKTPWWRKIYRVLVCAKKKPSK